MPDHERCGTAMRRRLPCLPIAAAPDRRQTSYPAAHPRRHERPPATSARNTAAVDCTGGPARQMLVHHPPGFAERGDDQLWLLRNRSCSLSVLSGQIPLYLWLRETDKRFKTIGDFIGTRLYASLESTLPTLTRSVSKGLQKRIPSLALRIGVMTRGKQPMIQPMRLGMLGMWHSHADGIVRQVSEHPDEFQL